MTNLEFVKGEIQRYNKRFSTRHNPTNAIEGGLDFWENFVSVAIVKGDRVVMGYAKCNPNYDTPNNETGLSIATFRALKRIDGRI